MAAGYSAAAARSALASVAPFVQDSPLPEGLTRTMTGTGGELLTEQLIEAGAKYLFVTNASGLGPLCDALVARPQIQLIQGDPGRPGGGHRGRLRESLGQDRLRHVQPRRAAALLGQHVQLDEGPDLGGAAQRSRRGRIARAPTVTRIWRTGWSRSSNTPSGGGSRTSRSAFPSGCVRRAGSRR